MALAARRLGHWPITPLFLLFCGLALASPTNRFDPDRVSFEVEVNGLQLDYRVFGIYVLPGERVAIRSSFELQLRTDHTDPIAVPRGWDWHAPALAGLYPLHLLHDDEPMLLNVFVMRPSSSVKNGWLDHYRIGNYAKKPFRGLDTYEPPRGFIEVTPSTSDARVSPHFTIGQFLCKQASAWPKYLVLRPELAIKLERILEDLNASGFSAARLEIMSGFRTPWYHREIGNRTRVSRHLYGGAADIYVDASPRDGVMDDLNSDGKVDKADADYLYDLIERSTRIGGWQPFRGGLASYRANVAHGPFVHVDARGYRARWGR
jgi:hypothetical protein